jgi:uncharacterized protein (DUF2252 family)
VALNDSYVLGSNATFQGRVQAQMLAACVAIASEGAAVVNHPARLQLVHAILGSPTSLQNYAQMFALSVATDATVISDATSANTVSLTTANVATQQGLVTDAHISNAVSGQWNAFAQGIVA